MHPERRPDSEQALEATEARLRALPPPAVPGELEARLLAAIPPTLPTRPRRWTRWARLAGAVAAACFLVVLIWSARRGNTLVSKAGVNELPRPVRRENAEIVEGLVGRGGRHGTETSLFAWPLEETAPLKSSTALPVDLLN